jgi:hypothetical protein
MGMDQTVIFAGKALPGWLAVRDLLQQHGFPVKVMMIDGQLAFPDELPSETWRDLRVGTPQGMVTVRREPDRIVFVTWGNADSALQQAWNALAWAWAEAGGGQVQTPQGPVDAPGYRRLANLPEVLRAGSV